jgi:hypothetical protein
MARFYRRNAPPVARDMIAKYAGTCAECGGAINAGERIIWHGRGGAFHFSCSNPVTGGAPTDDDGGAERRHQERENAEYREGLAAGRRYSSERRIYGDALAEQFAMDEEAFRYNHGLDD